MVLVENLRLFRAIDKSIEKEYNSSQFQDRGQYVDILVDDGFTAVKKGEIGSEGEK